MAIKEFPDPRTAPEDGLLAIGGDLEAKSLMLAYRQGIFPWPMMGVSSLWFCPPERAILPFENLHLPRTLIKKKKNTSFRFTHDKAFASVIRSCARVHSHRYLKQQEAMKKNSKLKNISKELPPEGTWIYPEIVMAYTRLFELGHAHSFEAWDGDHLVGGIYGVDSGGAFAAESMFYEKPYASKFALIELISHLQSRGLNWLDIQVMTPHMKAMGAIEIERNEFLDLLRSTLEKGVTLF